MPLKSARDRPSDHGPEGEGRKAASDGIEDHRRDAGDRSQAQGSDPPDSIGHEPGGDLERRLGDLRDREHRQGQRVRARHLDEVDDDDGRVEPEIVGDVDRRQEADETVRHGSGFRAGLDGRVWVSRPRGQSRAGLLDHLPVTHDRD